MFHRFQKILSKELLEDFKRIGIKVTDVDECTVHDAAIAYRRTAKVLHPDKVGPNATADEILASTAAFQTLGKAYKSVINYLVDKIKQSKNEVVEDVERFTRDNFENFNFPHENNGSFTVEIVNSLADTWQDWYP